MDDTNYSVTVAEIVPLRESENQVKAVATVMINNMLMISGVTVHRDPKGQWPDNVAMPWYKDRNEEVHDTVKVLDRKLKRMIDVAVLEAFQEEESQKGNERSQRRWE